MLILGIVDEKANQLTLYVLDDSAVYWGFAVIFDFANDDFRVLTYVHQIDLQPLGFRFGPLEPGAVEIIDDSAEFQSACDEGLVSSAPSLERKSHQFVEILAVDSRGGVGN